MVETKIVSAPPEPPAPASSPPERASLQDGKIVITEKIQFDEGKATIKPESNSLIDAIADVLKKNEAVTAVSVEGHASSEGNAAANKKLSADRAHAVLDALVGKGIAKTRLTSVGWGSEKPIADNKTEDGREKNRRVEFVVVGGAAKATPAKKEGAK